MADSTQPDGQGASLAIDSQQVTSAPTASFVVGADLGGTNVRAAVIEIASGKIVARLPKRALARDGWAGVHPPTRSRRLSTRRLGCRKLGATRSKALV